MAAVVAALLAAVLDAGALDAVALNVAELAGAPLVVGALDVGALDAGVATDPQAAINAMVLPEASNPKAVRRVIPPLRMDCPLSMFRSVFHVSTGLARRYLYLRSWDIRRVTLA
ncbi:MAG: hypothetical protein JO057_04305 [Chloroflexi bacterium]|nr:hypothetical protein [Chloroflexota bacterium]